MFQTTNQILLTIWMTIQCWIPGSALTTGGLEPRDVNVKNAGCFQAKVGIYGI
jgi:hypothetical protein